MRAARSAPDWHNPHALRPGKDWHNPQTPRFGRLLPRLWSTCAFSEPGTGAPTAEKLREFRTSIRDTAAVSQTSALAVLLRFARLYILERYSREELFPLGLCNPRVGRDEIDACISREDLYDLQLRFNPPAYNYVTEDKVVFYLFCRSAGIRIPELYAVFDPALGWTVDDTTLSGREDWLRYFAEAAPDTFVIKPALGVHGMALGAYRRTAGGFVDSAGKRYMAGDLYDFMAANADFDRFVIQERLKNHPELLRISGAEAVQTVRAITLVREGTAPALVLAVQKIVKGPGLADNFRWGRTGNMVAGVDLASGTLERIVTGAPRGVGLREVERHPVTGVVLKGYQLPFWDELRGLVIDAARKMLPIRTVGWDVALTPDGPVIVEGNMWWHPDHHNALRQLGGFAKTCGLT